ncbi:MAG: hypothetical protein OEO79_06990 [Gemmatimonadota bacterium]|nr:hypothetical protein [Gemmatimonadota bacterium]
MTEGHTERLEAALTDGGIPRARDRRARDSLAVMNRLLALILSGLLVTCGGDSPSGLPSTFGSQITFETIAGTYTGALVSVSQGITLTATFSLTLVQTQGSLTGSFGLAGTLDDGVGQAFVRGNGTVTGTIAPGSAPLVNVTVTPDVCPNAAVDWSGTYDGASGALTISGDANIFDAGCVVVLTYEGTMVLNR